MVKGFSEVPERERTAEELKNSWLQAVEEANRLFPEAKDAKSVMLTVVEYGDALDGAKKAWDLYYDELGDTAAHEVDDENNPDKHI